MSTRFNSTSKTQFNVPGLQSGYGTKSSPSDLTIPPVGIEDADGALFNLFDKEIGFQVSTSDKSREEIKKVPVIFASAEKWALSKRSKGIRDKNGSLILPLITVVRTSIQQDPSKDVTGRGINQQTGEIVIQRRLDKSDRGYQNLINRTLLRHQTNLAVTQTMADDGQLSTDRTIGDLTDDPTVEDGGLLLGNKNNNIYETLSIPSPQFFTAQYEVTFWTQYTVQMFQLIELLMSSFLPQGNAWKLDTPKGYWFVATVDANTYNQENNTDDMSQEERMIKYKFTVNVPGYILATKVPGAPVPVKRFVSSPSISFDMGLAETTNEGSVDDPFLGSDDPTLPSETDKTSRADQRRVGKTRLYPGAEDTSPNDPALAALPRGRDVAKYKKITSLARNGKTVTKYARVISTNRYTGETVFSSDIDLAGVTIVITDD